MGSTGPGVEGMSRVQSLGLRGQKTPRLSNITPDHWDPNEGRNWKNEMASGLIPEFVGQERTVLGSLCKYGIEYLT